MCPVSPVIADVVWPALVLSGRIAAWWCIALGTLIEGAALWRFLRWPPFKAFFAAFLMNAVSAFCGSILLPVAGLRWEATADRTINAWFGWGTFNIASEAVTWLIAVLLSTLIETFVLWLIFLAPLTRRLIVVMLAANSVTTLLAAFWPWHS
jgi:hypothetical protein